MEFDDLAHRVISERKSVGMEDCAVITKTPAQQSPPPPADVFTRPSPLDFATPAAPRTPKHTNHAVRSAREGRQ